MKKYLLSLSLLISAGVVAQTIYFEENFETLDTITDTWTLHDRDGDGQNWFIFETQSSQGAIATSASWIPPDNPLTPDNWMVSPAIDLTNATGSTILAWQVYGQDQDYADENYSVYVSTSDDIEIMLEEEAIYNEVIGSSNGLFVQRFMDLSDFNGETIFVAIRHHETSDMFRINIDNVKVYKPAENDIEMLGFSVDKYITGDRTFTLKVRNLGYEDITSFDATLTINGTEYIKNITGISTPFGEEYEFDMEIAINTEGSFPIIAKITTEDSNMSNNSTSATFPFAPPVIPFSQTDSRGNEFDLYDRLENGQAIIMEFMGSACQVCEPVAGELARYIEENGSGEGKVQAIALSFDLYDDNSALNNLNWHGDYYEYPKFAYTNENQNNFDHYAFYHKFNEGDLVPFYLMICPDIENPSQSKILKHNVGYTSGIFRFVYNAALNQCPTATMDIVSLNKPDFDFTVYPNPVNDFVNVEFQLNQPEDVTLSVVNSIGQVITTHDLGKISGSYSSKLEVSSLEKGMYFIKIKTSNGEQTQRVSVL